MKIEQIQIDGFGCHKNLLLAFGNELTILCGQNEQGKTTVLAFIEAMFYGLNQPDSVKCRAQWRPWHGDNFGGSLIFTHNGARYTVTAVWGTTPEEDQVTVQQDGQGPVSLSADQTVGDQYVGLSQDSFRTFVLGQTQLSADQTYTALQQLDGLEAAAWVESTDTVLPAIAKLDQAQAQIQLGPKKALDNVLVQQTRLQASVEKAEAEALQLTAKITEAEAELAELNKKEIKPQSLDALTHSVNLLEKQKQARQLRGALDDLQDQYQAAYTARQKKRKPWSIILIVLLALNVVALAVLLLPQAWLPEFLPLDGMRSLTTTIVQLTAGTSLLLFSLLLIFVRTGGKTVLYELEEAIHFRAQALCEVLSIHRLDPQLVDEAMAELDTQCGFATQCLAAVDRDRLAKEALSEEIQARTQQCTYDRIQLETLYRSIQEKNEQGDAADQLEATRQALATLDKHLAAIALAQKLLRQAQLRQKSDLAPRLATVASELLKDFTAGRHPSMTLSRELKPSLSENGVVRNGTHFQGATGAQMTLALKLATLKLLANQGKPLPLLLDEPFAVYDCNRRNATLEALLRYAKENDHQIILTASHVGEPYTTTYAQYALSI